MSERTKTPSVAWAPYRGEIEPITKVLRARMFFHPNHIRIICGYEYRHLKEQVTDNVLINEDYYEDGICKCDLILRKDTLEVCRTTFDSDLDKRSKPEERQTLEIYGNKASFWLFARQEDVDHVYEELRKYIIGS